MANYIFSAERQLIFDVMIDGRKRLVQFGERSQFGASNFSTTDEKVAAAIRKHSMFKRGVITESTINAEDKDKSTGAVPSDKVPSIQKDPAQKATEEPDELDVIEVENFTQAKSAIIKRLGIDKNMVKTPPMLNKVAKDNGITIHYKKN